MYAYANAAVCAVARFTLITGRYAAGMGTQNMRSRYPIPARFKTYPSYLREAGYYCVNRSKTDYNFDTNDKSHWDESSPKAHWKNRKRASPSLPSSTQPSAMRAACSKRRSTPRARRAPSRRRPAATPSR